MAAHRAPRPPTQEFEWQQTLKVTLVPGDGIGPEVTHEAVLILEAISQWSGSVFHFTEKPIGGAAIRAHGSPLPPATLEAALDSDAVLLGAVGGNEFNLLPPDKRPEAGLLQLRQALGGFANLRPSVAYAPLSNNSPLRPEVTDGADILFVRELAGRVVFRQAAILESRYPRRAQHHGVHTR